MVGGYDMVCCFFIGNEIQWCQGGHCVHTRTWQAQVWEAGKLGKEVPFYEGFSSTLTI